MHRRSVAAATALVVWLGCSGSGSKGNSGAPGQSVVSASLSPGSTACPNGGSQFISASATTYACNGAPGVKGDVGAKGDVGPAPVVATIDPGSACTFGGASITTGAATAYCCNGAPGGSVVEVVDGRGVVLGRLVGVSTRATGGTPFPLWAKLFAIMDGEGTLWTVDSDGNVFADLAQQTEYYETVDCSGTPLIWSGPPQVPTMFAGGAGQPVIKGVPPAIAVTAHSYKNGTTCGPATQVFASAFRTVALGVQPLTLGVGPYSFR